MSDRTLWFIVNRETHHPIKLVQGEITVGPYVFSQEQDALDALQSNVWPQEIPSSLVVKPGSFLMFLKQLAQGLPPALPDAISFNSTPFELLGGLYPLTKKGAVFADEVQGSDFWKGMSAGQMYEHTTEVLKISVGISQAN